MGADELDLGLEVLKGFSGKVAQAALGFVGTIVFARVLGPTSFGAFYFLQSIVFISTRPLKGTGTAMAKRLSESGAPKREITGAGVGLALVGSVVSLPVLLVGDWLTSQTGVENAEVVFVSIFASVSLFFVTQRLLQGYGLIGARVWNDTLRSVFTLAAQLLFVLSGYGAAGMGYGLAAGTLVSAAIGISLIGDRPGIPSRQTVLSLWKYARYSIPESFVGKAYGRVDTLLLGVLSTTAFVGYYEVGMKLSVPATFLSGMVGSALFPKISNIDTSSGDVAGELQNAISYASVLSIPILFGALAIPEKLVVTAYSGTYRAAGPFLVGLVFAQVLSSQVTVYLSAIRGLDFPELSLRANVLGLATNLVTGITALFLIGPIGVALGSVAGEASQYIFLSEKVKQKVDVSRVSRPLLEQIATGLIMFVVVKIATKFVGIESVIELGAVVGLGATVYGVVLYTVSSNFRLTVRSIISDISQEYIGHFPF